MMFFKQKKFAVLLTLLFCVGGFAQGLSVGAWAAINWETQWSVSADEYVDRDGEYYLEINVDEERFLGYGGEIGVLASVPIGHNMSFATGLNFIVRHVDVWGETGPGYASFYVNATQTEFATAVPLLLQFDGLEIGDMPAYWQMGLQVELEIALIAARNKNEFEVTGKFTNVAAVLGAGVYMSPSAALNLNIYTGVGRKGLITGGNLGMTFWILNNK